MFRTKFCTAPSSLVLWMNSILFHKLLTSKRWRIKNTFLQPTFNFSFCWTSKEMIFQIWFRWSFYVDLSCSRCVCVACPVQVQRYVAVTTVLFANFSMTEVNVDIARWDRSFMHHQLSLAASREERKEQELIQSWLVHVCSVYGRTIAWTFQGNISWWAQSAAMSMEDTIVLFSVVFQALAVAWPAQIGSAVKQLLAQSVVVWTDQTANRRRFHQLALVSVPLFQKNLLQLTIYETV